MEKFNEIGLKNYSVIAFGGRKFYIPLNACVVSHQGDVLHIDFQGNNDAYGIVNGFRCYYVISYNKKTDTLETHIKEYVLDGVHVTCENQTSVSISCEDQKITVPGITGHIRLANTTKSLLQISFQSFRRWIRVSVISCANILNVLETVLNGQIC